MRRRRRFSSRRAVRRLIASAGERFAQLLQEDPDRPKLLHCGLEDAAKLGLTQDLQRLAAHYHPGKKEFSVLIYGRDA